MTKFQCVVDDCIIWWPESDIVVKSSDVQTFAFDKSLFLQRLCRSDTCINNFKFV